MQAPVHMAGTPVDDGFPDIGADPNKDGFLVAWEQQYSDALGPHGINARTLDGSNTTGAPFVVRNKHSNESTDCSRPVVAGGGTGWMLTRERLHDGAPYFDTHARIVWDPFSNGF